MEKMLCWIWKGFLWTLIALQSVMLLFVAVIIAQLGLIEIDRLSQNFNLAEALISAFACLVTTLIFALLGTMPYQEFFGKRTTRCKC